MHVIALVNQKGGCGKTTTAVHLAGALAARGDRVLLADLDPQGHATASLGFAAEGECGVAEVLLDGLPVQRGIQPVHLAALPIVPAGLHWPTPVGIDLLPASDRLAEVEEAAEHRLQPEQWLGRALQRVGTRYDFVLVDCPPRADGALTANALRASDTALLVVETGTYALQGARKAMRILARFSRELDRTFEVRVVATLFDPEARLAREILVGMYSQFGELLLDTVIRTSEELRESAAMGAPIQWVYPQSSAVREFDALASELRACLPVERRPALTVSSEAR